MKVLFICSGNNVSGINPIISRQANSLIKKGIEVDFFKIEGKGVTGYLKAIPRLKSYLNLNKYDVLHAHYALCGYVAYFGSVKQKRVLSFMGSDLLSSIPRSSGTGFLVKFLNRINIIMAKLFFDKVILKSEEMMKVFGDSSGKILIPNGVDFDVFKMEDKATAMRELKISQDRHHIIFVSNPSRPEKNFALAEKTLCLLDRSKYELHVVYNCDTRKLVKYYNAADVLLMTSFYEGSPNVIKEAMACNCPVVTTNVGDVSLLLGSVNGCFVTDFNPENIKDCLIKAVDFREKNRFTNGVEKLRRLELSSDAIADKLIELYKSLSRV